MCEGVEGQYRWHACVCVRGWRVSTGGMHVSTGGKSTIWIGELKDR